MSNKRAMPEAGDATSGSIAALASEIRAANVAFSEREVEKRSKV